MKTTLFTLPLYILSNFTHPYQRDSWNIVRNIFGMNLKNYEIIKENFTEGLKTEDILKVFYPKGSYSPSKTPVGGIGFFASPRKIFMANEVIFKYQVYFDNSFDPVLGGKLPGLFIGQGTQRKHMVGASGGNHALTSSCRIAWRADLKAEAYVYLPEQQHQNYSNIPGFVLNKKFGDSLWRGIFQFYKYKWNDISIRLKTNTIAENNIPNYNGELEISINNITQRFDQLVWRTQKDYNINAIVFETFFGGSQPKTATPNDTWTYFKNIQLQRLS